MREKNLQAFIVPSTDAHMSEYIPGHWASRQWLSGFTGSAGTVAVTLDKAGLWTDSRYFLQAADELSGSEIGLFKDRLPGTTGIVDRLKGSLGAGDHVGIDGEVFAAKEALKLKAEFEAENIQLVTTCDPFDAIWPDRPPLPSHPVELYPVELTGRTTRQKIERVLAEAEKEQADSVWISTPDTIAWLFNIRGRDMPYHPLVISHAWISRSGSVLFVDTGKVSPAVAEALGKEGVGIVDYHRTGDFLSETCNRSVCVDSSRVSLRLYGALSARNWVIDRLSVADRLKCVKNDVEAEGFRRCVIRDGIALTRFLMWLEEAVPEGRVTEYGIGVKLRELRGEQPRFAGESFPTIAGYAANGAVIHYHPREESSLTVRPEGLLLIDSGGHYADGTTDVTRTIAVGNVTDEMKRDYTLVLKGLIALSGAIFPAGTRGSQLDVLARKAMWQQGINYLHGTGHGVGHYLCVHEGPQSIRQQEENPVEMLAGMGVTNEPGIYRDHLYGIRIENMMLTRFAMTSGCGDF